MKYEVIMGNQTVPRVHVYVHVITIVHDREGSYERCEWLNRVCEWKRVAIARFTCMNVLYMG